MKVWFVWTELVQPSPKIVGGGEVTEIVWFWLAQALPLQACSAMVKVPAEPKLVEKLEPPPLGVDPPEADHE